MYWSRGAQDLKCGNQISLNHRACRQTWASPNIIPLQSHPHPNNRVQSNCYPMEMVIPFLCRLYERRGTSTHTFNYLENSYHLLALPLSSLLDRAVYSTGGTPHNEIPFAIALRSVVSQNYDSSTLQIFNLRFVNIAMPRWRDEENLQGKQLTIKALI